MNRYSTTNIARSQLVIKPISMGRAILVLDRERPLKILLEFYKNLFAGCGPKRVDPDDKKHRLPSVMKVISGSLPEVANP